MSEDSSYWTAVANVVAERPYGPGGLETRSGTKHFQPGAKVYIIDWFPGMCDAVTVIGHHRKSHQLMKLVMRVNTLEQFRPKVCYSPAVHSLIAEHFATEGGPHRLTKEFAEYLCEVLPTWKTPQQHP
ncbi:hypothetical protein J0X19_12140 [Hymenobacter sp. BT186]|uniref:Uncharacterized protein n=1 Tax=Hymenobacter telluris TaxID=2816474 RepID=A0A939EWX6_9BACT|nr:hypothetical protein [Hymenobacter telluris]MBO0358699.1 hypothetical protein [Hymenobacter telluris]MBW3374725.1 hypothetical protein [Hymenobacter norwichensis]